MKTYVEVICSFSCNGQIKPMYIKWGNGTIYEITKINKIIPLKSVGLLTVRSGQIPVISFWKRANGTLSTDPLFTTELQSVDETAEYVKAADDRTKRTSQIGKYDDKKYSCNLVLP